MIFKRIFDIFGSLFGIIFFSPLLILIAVLIKCFSSGPVLFRQKRIGLNMVPFTILKFRTMCHDPENRGLSITGASDSRITPVGRILRKWKLDELPQLFNILRGEMSFVGPRPEVPEYVKLYTAEQRDVLTVRPGLTDPGSIIYSNEEALFPDDPAERERIYTGTILPDKLRLNLEYVRNRSFLGDIGIILTTVKCILFSRENPALEDSDSIKLTGKK